MTDLMDLMESVEPNARDGCRFCRAPVAVGERYCSDLCRQRDSKGFPRPDHQSLVELFNEDCIPGMAKLPAESVDLLVTSIPFASLFMYSGKTADVGNSPDAGLDFVGSTFGLHMRFWTEQVFRVMKPGTIVAIHIQQLLTYKVQHGFMGRRDFRGAVIDILMAGGFDWVGEVAINKNPQRIAQTQKLHSLMFVTGRRDGRRLASCPNDYILWFKKPGEHPKGVQCLYHPELNPDGWVSTDEWISWAHGCWTDILEIDTLDGWRSAREEDDERHVCPLQLEVIRRNIKLYSNPGEVVMDPFMGIGSSAYVAIEQGRDAVGFELKESYYQQSQANVAKIQSEVTAPPVDDLFSLSGLEVS